MATLPSSADKSDDADHTPEAAVLALQKLNGVSAEFTLPNPAWGTTVRLSVQLPEFTSSLLLEVAEIAHSHLAMADTGYRTLVQAHHAGDLVYEADGLGRMNDYLRDDIRFLFAAIKATGLAFRLRSHELSPSASRTLEAINAEYDPAVNWVQYLLLPDPSGNQWSRLQAPGLDVTGPLPSSFANLIHKIPLVGTVCDVDEPVSGSVLLTVDDGGAKFIAIFGTDVERARVGELPHSRTGAWSTVTGLIALMNPYTVANIRYLDSDGRGGGQVVHIGYSAGVLARYPEDVAGDENFFAALLESGVEMAPLSGPGEFPEGVGD